MHELHNSDEIVQLGKTNWKTSSVNSLQFIQLSLVRWTPTRFGFDLIKLFFRRVDSVWQKISGMGGCRKFPTSGSNWIAPNLINRGKSRGEENIQAKRNWDATKRGRGEGERIGTNIPLGGKKFGAKNLRQEKTSHLLFFKTGGNIWKHRTAFKRKKWEV